MDSDHTCPQLSHKRRERRARSSLVRGFGACHIKEFSCQDITSHRLLKRISFIREFINYVQDENTELFVLDEAGKLIFILFILLGFGTSPFCNYSYSPIGEKSVKHTSKLALNLTVCATISCHKTEMLRFFYGGGTKMEVFEEYFSKLVEHLNKSY